MTDGTDDWRLKPKIGLGELKFGLSPAQVDAMAAIYGASKGLVSDRIPDAMLESTLAELGEGLSAEEKQEILSLYLASGPAATSETEVRGDEQSIVLAYESGHLVEILADTKVERLTFDGVSVFGPPPIEVVRHIAKVTGEVPVIMDEEVAFPEHFIFLFEFLRDGSGGNYAEGSKADRSIVWRSGPRDGGTDISLYKPMTI